MRLPGWYWRALYRSHNRLLDGWARLNGACNASTWDPLRRSYAAGYAHWRCGKAHGHAGPHRFNNYTWWYRGESRFDPLPVTNAERAADPRWQELTHVKVTGYRHGIRPRGRERAWRRECALQAAIRRDAREKAQGERAGGGRQP